MIDCTARDRTRIFNLGYYTWVEQQGTPFELFEQRRSQDFWRGLRRYLGVWDELITEFNARVVTIVIVGWRCAVCGATVDVADADCRSAARERRRTTATTCCTRSTSAGDRRAARRSEPVRRLRPAAGVVGVRRANGMTEQACIGADPRRGRRVRRSRRSPRSAPLSAELGARGVGEGRDRQRGRQPQGPPPRDDPAPPAGGRSAADGRALAAAARHRVVRQRGDRRRRPSPPGVDWPIEVFVPDWADERVLDRARASSARRSPTARAARATRRATRRCCGSGRRWRPVPSRSACRARRTRCASTVGARSAGSWPTPAWRSTVSSCRSAAGRSPRAPAGGSAPACASTRVQAEGCAPLARAWERAAGAGARARSRRRWGELMTPWDDPHSAADGILDDETYDWLGVFDVVRRSGGRVVVAPEEAILRAHELGRGHRHPRQRHRHRRPRRPPHPRRRPHPRRTRRRHLLRRGTAD